MPGQGVTPVRPAVKGKGTTRSVLQQRDRGERRREPGVAVVEVAGKAKIIGGDEGRARSRALLDAYRNAVNQGAGVMVKEVTEMRNFQHLISAISAESAGYVRSYEELSSGRSKTEADTYVFWIKAEVVKGDMRDEEGTESFRLLLDALGNPRLLVVLEERSTVVPNRLAARGGAGKTIEIAIKEGGESVDIKRSEQDAPALDALPASVDSGGPETFFAEMLQDLGYEAVVGDDLVRQGIPADKVDRARRGDLEAMRELSVQGDADLALFGHVRVSVSPTVYVGRDVWGSHARAVVRALVPNTGERVSITTASGKGFAANPDGSTHDAVRNVCKRIVSDLGWSILDTVSEKGRCVAVRVTDCSLEAYGTLRKGLESTPTVTSVAAAPWRKDDGGHGEFKVYTSQTGTTGFELASALAQREDVRVSASTVSRLTLDLSVVQ